MPILALAVVDKETLAQKRVIFTCGIHTKGRSVLIKRKLRKLDKVLSALPIDCEVYVAAQSPAASTLSKLGFSHPAKPGDYLLPDRSFGIACRRNADGYDIIRRDLPKETKTRQITWRWKEFHGRDTVDREGIVDKPYLRYPREHVVAYSQELEMHVNSKGVPVVSSGPYKPHADNGQAVLLNTIRMYVEIFGSCEVVADPSLIEDQPRRRQLNWVILPPGRRLWEESESAIAKLMQNLSSSSQIVVKDRLNSILRYEPEFAAFGQHGFNRYVVYGWDKNKLYLLESTDVDNATYVFKDDWESLSKLTKAEVLATDAHHARLIHHKGWTGELNGLMAANGIRPKI